MSRPANTSPGKMFARTNPGHHHRSCEPVRHDIDHGLGVFVRDHRCQRPRAHCVARGETGVYPAVGAVIEVPVSVTLVRTRAVGRDLHHSGHDTGVNQRFERDQASLPEALVMRAGADEIESRADRNQRVGGPGARRPGGNRDLRTRVGEFAAVKWSVATAAAVAPPKMTHHLISLLAVWKGLVQIAF